MGYLTTAINSGHRYPGQGSRTLAREGKKDKFTGGRVEGRYFYEYAQPSMEAIARETAQQVVDGLVKFMEDG